MNKRKKAAPVPTEADHRNMFWLRATEASAYAKKGYGGQRVTDSMAAEAHLVALAWSELARELERMR